MADEPKTQAEIEAEAIAAAEAKAKADAAKAEEFTPGQQKKLTELINSAHDRGHAAGVKKTAETIEGLKAQIEELGKKETTKEGNVDVEEMKKEIKTLRDDATKNHERSINASLLTEISEFNVARPKQVATLLRGHIKVDDAGRLTVQSDEGALIYNKAGEEMTVKEYISDWLDKNQHMLNAPGTPGAGSRPGDYNNKGSVESITRAEFDALSNDDKQKIALEGKVEIVDAA